MTVPTIVNPSRIDYMWTKTETITYVRVFTACINIVCMKNEQCITMG